MQFLYTLLHNYYFFFKLFKTIYLWRFSFLWLLFLIIPESGASREISGIIRSSHRNNNLQRDITDIEDYYEIIFKTSCEKSIPALIIEFSVSQIVLWFRIFRYQTLQYNLCNFFQLISDLQTKFRHSLASQM